MTTLAELRAGFLNPPKEYGLRPLWDLNDDLQPETMRASLEEQAAQGITGVFLHPRTGMKVEYLSDDYWRAIAESIEAGKALGLETWLYDEYNWPSGVVGGKLLREHPEYRQVFLDYRVSRCASGESCNLSAPASAQILSARACPDSSDDTVDLLPAVQLNTLHWTAPDSTGNSIWHVVILFTDIFPGRLWATASAPWASGEAGALDYLNPDAVREFIRLTHEAYRERFGADFGKQIPGIFTDEPATYYGWQWTPRFGEIFHERTGYDLMPRLHELVLPAGNYIQTRYDYHRVALDLYAEAFFKQIADWSDQHGLVSTGHLLFEDKLDFLPAGQGGFFSTLRHLHMPGIDYLGDRTGLEASDIFVAPNVGAKSLSSLAHATGKSRSLVELYGGNGWATSLARYKNVLNWVEVCGVNCIDPHTAYLSIKGHRKRDFPASHTAQNPWWRYYRQFAEYATRLSNLNAQGIHVADVALLYPQSTFWTEHILWQKSERWNEVAGAFTAISTALLRLQRDYDYLFEETLLDGNARAEGGKLVLGAESFSLIVLPPLTTIPLRVLEVLRDFAVGGGTLVALGRLPSHSTAQRDDPRVTALLEAMHSTDRLTFIEISGAMSESTWTSLLQSVLDALHSADILVESSLERDIVCQHRRLDGDHLYLFANLSGEEGDAQISLRTRENTGGNLLAQGAPASHDFSRSSMADIPVVARRNASAIANPFENLELWDVERGIAAPLSTGVTPDGRISLTHHFLPFELVAIVATSAAAEAPPRFPASVRAERTPGKVESEIALAGWTLRPEGPNTHLLDSWQVRYGGEERALLTSRYDSLEAMARANRADAAAKGIDPSEWTFFMRVAREPQSPSYNRQWPPEGAIYERSATFRAGYLPSDIALVYEDLGEPVEIDINGRRYTDSVEPCLVWDRSNRQASLRGWLRFTDNTITLRTRMPSYRALPPATHGLEPVVLRGSFTMREGLMVAPQVALPELRPWDELGWPNYSGAMTYHCDFRVPTVQPGKRYLLTCDKVHETMDVTVNGAHAGIRLWPTYRIYLTSTIQPGENRLAVTVTNTLSNLLTRPVSSGLGGTARIQVVKD